MPCELVKGENFTAIQCGKPRGHTCDSNGPGVLILTDAPYEVEDNDENRKKYDSLVCGGSVNCSQCGRSAYSAMMWI